MKKPDNIAKLAVSPLYKKAAEIMTARIAQGQWPPGTRLANEFDLADEFGVSQGTIRKALMALERRGLILRSPGRGTVVATTTAESSLYAFFRMRDENDIMLVPQAYKEKITRRPATPQEASLLQIEQGEVYVIRRVRQNAKRLFTLEQLILPLQRFEKLETYQPLANSLYPFFQEKFGISVASMRENLSAVIAEQEHASALDIALGTPLLKVQRVSFDLSDRPVELRTSFYLTSFGTYAVKLKSRPSDK